MLRYIIVKENSKTGARSQYPTLFRSRKYAEKYIINMLANDDEACIAYIVEELPIVAEKCPDCKGSGQILKAEHWVDICGIPVLINELEKCPECGGKGTLIYVRLPIEEGDWDEKI